VVPISAGHCYLRCGDHITVWENSASQFIRVPFGHSLRLRKSTGQALALPTKTKVVDFFERAGQATFCFHSLRDIKPVEADHGSTKCAWQEQSI
jgi:hypothetical protein